MTTMPPSTPSQLSIPATPAAATALHQPFSWLSDSDKGDASANRNADTMDAFRGIATCLQLIEMSNLDREMADPGDSETVVPTLSIQDTGRLMRLAILVATEWGNKADCSMLSSATAEMDGVK